MAVTDKKHGTKTLFVSNLPYSTTNDDLENVFSDIGPIKTCFVVSDKGDIFYFPFCCWFLSLISMLGQLKKNIKNLDILLSK